MSYILYIYIYIYREREIERERETNAHVHMIYHMQVYTYPKGNPFRTDKRQRRGLDTVSS